MGFPDLRMTIERLDTFRLANDDICHETKKGKIKGTSYVSRTEKPLQSDMQCLNILIVCVFLVLVNKCIQLHPSDPELNISLYIYTVY